MKNKNFLFISGILLLILIFSIVFTQMMINKGKSKYAHIEQLRYIPSPKVMKIASLGFKDILADFIWMRAIQYYGAIVTSPGRKLDASDNTLYDLAVLTTTIDPKFDFVYRSTGLFLNFYAFNQIENSNNILKMGLENLQREKINGKPMIELPSYDGRYYGWEIPFYLGYNYLFVLKDTLTAVKYMEKASELPGCPPYIAGLAAKLMETKGRRDIAILYLTNVYNNTNNEKVKKQVGLQIELLIRLRDKEIFESLLSKYKTASSDTQRFNIKQELKEILSEMGMPVSGGLIENMGVEKFLSELITEATIFYHIAFLEEKMFVFEDNFNRPPNDIDELKFVTSIPKEPRGGYYYIDKETGRIKSSTMK